MYTVSVDIGGTFTDIVIFDEANGRTVVGKALTTPADLRKGVINGLKQAADDLNLPLNGLLAEAHRFVHATTQSSGAGATVPAVPRMEQDATQAMIDLQWDGGK